MLVGLAKPPGFTISGQSPGLVTRVVPLSGALPSSYPPKGRSSAFLLRRKCGARVRCSATRESFVSASTSDVAAGELLDCVVVGGGISGLCIAQALATKHRDAVGSVIVTEARERVGGNITTVERDGYLWEEGPNSFQPNDAMLTMAVNSNIFSLPLFFSFLVLLYVWKSNAACTY